jgi:hypothetical protein
MRKPKPKRNSNNGIRFRCRRPPRRRIRKHICQRTLSLIHSHSFDWDRSIDSENKTAFTTVITPSLRRS